MDEKEYLKKEIKECKRKLNLAGLFKYITVFTALGGVFAILLEGLSLAVPFYYVHLFAALSILAGLFAGAVTACIKRRGMKNAAHCLDSFGLKERVLTAYEHINGEQEFDRLQRTDAVMHLKEKKQENALKIPLLPDKRHLLALVLSLGLALALSFVPSAARKQAKILHEIEEQAKEKEKDLQKLVKEMENISTDALTDEQKAALKEMLESLNMSMEELKRADSKESLAAAAQKLEYKYRQTAEGLENMASALKDSSAAGIADASQTAKANANDAPDGTQTASAGGQDNNENEGGGDQNSGNGSGGDQNNGNGSGSDQNNGNGGDGGQNGDGNNGNGGGNGNGSGGNGDGNGNGNGNGGGSGNGQGRGTGSGDGAHDYISIPNGVGDDPSVSGKKNGDENSDYYRAQNGLAWNGDHVSLDSVISDYTKNAYDGIESGRYPGGMQNVIKDYFKNLND